MGCSGSSPAKQKLWETEIGVLLGVRTSLPEEMAFRDKLTLRGSYPKKGEVESGSSDDRESWICGELGSGIRSK